VRRIVALVAAVLCATAAEAAPHEPLVLFDEAHGQRFLVGAEGPLDLARLGDAFRGEEARVDHLVAPFSAESLAAADVVVVSGAFAPVLETEQDALLAYLDRGGSLAVMLHIGPPVAELLRRLEIAISTGVIRESDGVLHGNPIDFRVTQLVPHPLTSGLTGFALYGAWALLPESPRHVALARTQGHAWVDLNHSDRFDAGDAMQSFVVAIAGTRGEGRFVVFGDDAMFQNQFLAEGRENRKLATNLASWLLKRGSEGRVAALEGLRPARPGAGRPDRERTGR